MTARIASAIAYPPSTPLARTPTPLVPCPRMSERLGVDFLVKRDDMTGVELSGNKIRKLEFLLADAIAQGADTVITGGGEQSNHCRATALAATRLGLRSTLLLRCDDPQSPPATRGNILLDRLAGADIVWIDRATWARRAEAFESQAERLRGAGRKPYIIPEGGSNAVGSWGYVKCCEELESDLASLPAKATTVVYACGSGGTGAGLVVGAALLGWADKRWSVAGFNVCDDADTFVDIIDRIATEMIAQSELDITVARSDIRIVDGYVGGGYAVTRPEELEVAVDFARRESIIVDPVYTGKALYGLVRELERDRGRFGERVVFVHTGGLFGVFPKADAFADVL